LDGDTVKVGWDCLGVKNKRGGWQKNYGSLRKLKCKKKRTCNCMLITLRAEGEGRKEAWYS
jgi:hypothetical protein